MHQEPSSRYMTAEQLKALQRQHQQVLAQRWLDGRTVLEIARESGLNAGHAQEAIAFGLLGLGEVTVHELVVHGFIKPKGMRDGQGPEAASSGREVGRERTSKEGI